MKKIKSGFSLEKTLLIFRDEMIYSGLISLQTSEYLPDEILAMLLTFEGYSLAILTVYNMTWIDFFYIRIQNQKIVLTHVFVCIQIIICKCFCFFIFYVL